MKHYLEMFWIHLRVYCSVLREITSPVRTEFHFRDLKLMESWVEKSNQLKCTRPFVSFTKSCVQTLAFGVILLLPSLSGAVEYVNISQILPLTGAVSKDAENVAAGVKVGVDATNAKGGIRGLTVRLQTVDDQYKPEETERLFKNAVNQGAIAAIMPVGSASLLRLLSNGTLDAMQLPIVGAVPGAEVLRLPGNPWLFHIRSGDDQQIGKIVDHAWTVGQRRMAILYGDIPFGHAGLAAVNKHLKRLNTKPVFEQPFGMAKPEEALMGVIDKLKSTSTDSVLLIAGATQSGKIAKLLRDGGLFIPVYGLSYSDVASVCAIAGTKHARGIGLAQVVPNHASRSLSIALDFQRDWTLYAPKGMAPSQYAFESYIGWKIFTEALMRSNAPMSRDGVRKSLEQLKNVSIGGYQIDFGSQKREGSAFVDIGVINDNCQLRY